VTKNLKYFIYLFIVHSIILSFASHTGASELEFFSEEQGLSKCPNGQLITGIWCRGKYCDSKKLQCVEYTNQFDPDAQHEWSRWFSDERPNSETTKNGFASGLGCSGNYCDNMRIRYTTTPKLKNTGDCYWTNLYSEEQGFRSCNQGYFVSGIKCTGNYCDNIALYCCRGSQ
jgi:hypothetical protein